jgi:hypothetical protein
LVINLTGLLNDGSAFRPSVPQNPRTPVRVQKSITLTINFQIQRPNGSFVRLTNWTIGLTVKKKPSDTFAAMYALGQISPSNPQLVTFSFQPTDFRNTFAGIYGYDITAIQPSGGPRDVVMPLSPWFIEDTEAGSKLPLTTPTLPPAGISFAAQVVTITTPGLSDSVSVNAAAFPANQVSAVMGGSFSNPDVPRCVRAAFGTGWDGGALTVSGLDQFGQAVVDVLAASPGGTTDGLVAFSVVSGVSKATQGASAAVATLGRGSRLGILAKCVNNQAMLTADNAPEGGTIDIVKNTIIPTTVPNGLVSYLLVVNV